MVIHILFVFVCFACLLFLCNILKVCLCILYLFLSMPEVSLIIVAYGHTHIACFVWFCLFVVFMQYFKSLSAYVVSLPLKDVGFCDSCSLWSKHFVCFVWFCLLFLCKTHKVCLCSLYLFL